MIEDLKGANRIKWSAEVSEGLITTAVLFGRDESGVGEVQIALATVTQRPSRAMLEPAWRDRGAGSAMPVVVVAQFGTETWILGPNQNSPLVGPLPLERATSQLQAILNEPDGVAARRLAQSIVDAQVTTGEVGFTNHFLFASYFLKNGVPKRPDWASALELAQHLSTSRGRALIENLGFEVQPALGDVPNILILRGGKGDRRAVAVLLDETEQFDQRSPRFQISPVAHGLEVAGRENAPWVIVMRQSTLRLYPGKDGVGVGQRGQSETYFEIDLNLVDSEYVGLLSLVFSADALEDGGSAEQILIDSGRYAADLGTRLRDRVYKHVVPEIAVAIANRLPTLGVPLDANGLNIAYGLTLRVLFRLIFQAYGEDTGLLPAGRNEGYDANSLQAFINRDLNADPEEYSDEARSIWLDLTQVWDAIYNGNARWAVPAYGGSLFDPTTSEGRLLNQIELPDSLIGPALQNLLSENTEDGMRGSVDFRSLQVRDFGTIYEGLLESSLSVAEGNLALDKNEAYVPTENDDWVVEKGRAYFHSASGDRKATGSYYTPKIVVDYLIDNSIAPALNDHLEKVKGLVDSGNEREAAQLFWDFRVADIAMGSAHFLVAAVDKIERGMRDFLTHTPIPLIRAELSRLAEKARSQLGRDLEAASGINEAQLLRRQVARRCIYGLDINPLAVELSRLAIWIHTFVPGLPMSSLEHNLVLGNALTGIGTIDEAQDALGLDGLFVEFGRAPLENAKNVLADFANADDADKSEVAKSVAILEQALEAALPAKNMFDTAIATRIGLVDKGSGFSQEEMDRISAEPDVVRTLKGLDCAHLPFLFPEVFLRDNPGFDVLIGNPPWEELMVEEPRFWLRIRPGLYGLKPAELKAEIARLRIEREDLLPQLEGEIQRVASMRKVLLAGPFPGLGVGDIDLYAAFAWRYWQTLRVGGSLAFVSPRTLFNTAGGELWRRAVLKDSHSQILTLINRAGWVFEGVDPRYSVALSVITKREGIGENGETGQLTIGGPFFSSDEFTQRQAGLPTVTYSSLELSSSNVAIPSFPSKESASVFAQLRESPRLDRRGPGWDFRPIAELHATNDRELFDSGTETASKIPVVGGAGFDLWQPETGEVNAWADPAILYPALQAKRQRQVRLASSVMAGLPLDWAEHESTLPLMSPRIAFRNITNATNRRTMVTALIPPRTALTNIAPYLFNRSGSARSEAYLLGVLSSIPLDWFARRYVELSMNFHILDGLPIPDIEKNTLISDRVVMVSGRLAAVDERFASWAGEVGVPVASVKNAEEKLELIYELDALVALLYGLKNSEIEHIYETFHRGWDYRTRFEAVLGYFEAWKDKL